MTLKYLFKINIFLFFFYVAAYYLAGDFSVFAAIKTATGIALLFLSGINCAVILQIAVKRKFNAVEFLCLSIISAFFILPAILTFEYIFLKKIYSFLPIANIAAIFVLLLAAKILARNKDFTDLPEIVFSGFKKITRHPAFTCGVIYLAVIIATTFTYPHLPDGDPYTWISRLGTLYDKSSLSSITSRPLFSALFYYFKELTDISIFTVFKYLVPFFLILPLAPAWLAASQLKNKFQQYLVLLIPLAVPNTILYAQMAMPQAIMIIFTFYFAFFLIHAYLSKKEIFYYLAGLLSFLAIFYHEAAIIIFVIWLAITLIYNFRIILTNKLISLLIVIIIISNYEAFHKYVLFVTKWINKIIHLIINKPALNYLYPYQYKNIDGNNMGWQSIEGVIKFYSFYIGPLIMFLIIFVLFYLYKNKINFKKTTRFYFSHKELAVIFLSFLAFFAISEILPRFPGIAMLPDRAWIFTGIFFTCAILPFVNFRYFSNFYKLMFYFFIFLVIISIYGAFFVNYQKKHLISQADIRAAEWIKNNTHADRIFISASKRITLAYYSNSKIINVPSDFYFSENYNDFIKLSESCVKRNEFSVKMTNDYLKNLAGEIEKTRLKLQQVNNVKSEIGVSLNFAKLNQDKTAQFVEGVKETTDVADLRCDKKYYIFYSEMDEKNPYYNRPYNLDKWGTKNPSGREIIFDKYPEKFKKIYGDSENKIYIWEIII